MNPPRARTDELLRTDLADEVVVYDKETKRAHGLNKLAVAVWTSCDGHRTVAELSSLVSERVGFSVSELAVRRALRQLEKANLLLEHAAGNGATLGRREMLQKAGQLGAAAVVTPMVATVLIPTAAAAASPGPPPLATFLGLASYLAGCPPDAYPGTPCGQPDTSFIQITNQGPGTFTGTLSFRAVACGCYIGCGPFNPDYNVVLAPGQSVSVSFNPEASNYGGYNGPCNQTTTPQDGAQFLAVGTVALAGHPDQNVNFSIFDRDIHSGVPRTNPFGVTLDNYILQGGDPYGRDTFDDYEESQAPGHFQFSSS